MNQDSPLQNSINSIIGPKNNEEEKQNASPASTPNDPKKNIPGINGTSSQASFIPGNVQGEHHLPPNTIIRTYEGDVAEALSRNKTTVTQVAIAQNNTNENPQQIIRNNEDVEDTKKTRKNIIYVVLSLILLCGGAYGGYYLYTNSFFFSAQKPVEKVAVVPKYIIPSDQSKEIDVTGLNQKQVIAKLSSIPYSNEKENITNIVLSQKLADGTTVRMPFDKVKDLFNVYIPEQVLRSLTKEYFIGHYSSSNNADGYFVAVKNNYFQNVFAGLIAWEDLMINDLRAYMVEASSTSALRGSFVDRIVKNKDVRVFKDVYGNTLLLYSFVNNDLIVFAKNESTLSYIVTRLDQSSLSR